MESKVKDKHKTTPIPIVCLRLASFTHLLNVRLQLKQIFGRKGKLKADKYALHHQETANEDQIITVVL